jgi:hypothetical protein
MGRRFGNGIQEFRFWAKGLEFGIQDLQFRIYE